MFARSFLALGLWDQGLLDLLPAIESGKDCALCDAIADIGINLRQDTGHLEPNF